MIRKLITTIILTNIIWSNSYAIKIKQWTTINGAKVLFSESHDLKMIDVAVTFNAGSARDGKKLGLAQITNIMMPTGTKLSNEELISKTFDNQGTIFSNQSYRDMSIFRLRSLSNKKNLDPSVKIFAEIVQQPVFDQEIFKREKARILQAIKMAEQSPASIASKAFMGSIYKNHPYGNPPLGTAETIKNLTVNDLNNFHQKFMVAKNATISIVGDINLVNAKILANTIIGQLKHGEKAQQLPKVTKIKQKTIKKIEFDISQTHIIIGQPGMTRTDNDYFNLYVGNHILGGSGLVSRISNEIREKHGLAYSAYSYFTPMQVEGPFKIGTQTKTKSTKKTLTIALKTLDDFIKNGPTELELTNAKKNITGGFALKIDNNQKISTYLSFIGFYNLPLDYLDTFKDKVNKVTIDSIKKVWQNRISSTNLAIILVGKHDTK